MAFPPAASKDGRFATAPWRKVSPPDRSGVGPLVELAWPRLATPLTQGLNAYMPTAFEMDTKTNTPKEKKKSAMLLPRIGQPDKVEIVVSGDRDVLDASQEGLLELGVAAGSKEVATTCTGPCPRGVAPKVAPAPTWKATHRSANRNAVPELPCVAALQHKKCGLQHFRRRSRARCSVWHHRL